MPKSLLFTFAAFTIHISAFAEQNCRSVAELRIDNSSDLAQLSDVCKVDTLTVFSDRHQKIVLPNLKEARFINIDSRGIKALALPALEHVRDLYISGSGMEVAEFPALETVEGHLVVDGQHLTFLNLPSLSLAGRVAFNNCPNLEFVFAEKLHSIQSFRHTATPSLNPAVVSLFENISVMSEAEWKEHQLAAKRMQEYKLRLMTDPALVNPIRPTGHKTKFRDYSSEVYYNWYPYEYDRYWWVVGAFGLQWYYRLP